MFRSNRAGGLACLCLILGSALPICADDLAPPPKSGSPLDRLVDVNYDDQALTAIAADLSQQSGASIRLDHRQLDEYGIDPAEARVTLRAKQISLRHALYWVGKPHELMWVERGESILLTPHDQELGRLQLFDVLDLVRLEPDSKRLDYRSLMDLISSVLEPDTWEDVGGEGMMRPANGYLAVRQYGYVLDEIPPLLTNLKRAIAAGQASEVKPPTEVSIDLQERSDQSLSGLLRRPWKIGMMAKEMPLTELAELLQSSYKVPVLVDHSVLEEMGIDATVLVTPPERAVSLAEALQVTLNGVDLGCYTAHGALVLSGDSAVETHLSTRVYPVGDMLGHFVVDDAFGDDQLDFDLDDLIDLLTASVAPDSWDEVGGPGSVVAKGGNLLIISQTPLAHSTLEQQLGHLRTAFAKRGAVERPKLKDRKQRMRLAVYVFETPESEAKRLANEKAQQEALREQAQKGLAPGAVPGAGGPDALLVPPMIEPKPAAPDDPGIDPFGAAGKGGGIADPFGGGAPAPPVVDPFGGSGDPFADPPGTPAPPEPNPFDEENPFGLMLRNRPPDVSVPTDVLAKVQFGFGLGNYALDQPAAISEEKLLEIIQGLIEPTSWKRDEKVFAATGPGRIVILHTEAVHEKIRELAERLGVKDFHELVAPESGWPLPVVGDGGFGGPGIPKSGGFF